VLRAILLDTEEFLIGINPLKPGWGTLSAVFDISNSSLSTYVGKVIKKSVPSKILTCVPQLWFERVKVCRL